MDERYIHKIITPKEVELLSNHDFLNDKAKSNFTEANIISIHIAETRLTCCCEYKNHIICAGFSGELFFVDKTNLSVVSIIKVSDSIIRSMQVVYSERIILISTDAKEIIVFDLEKMTKSFCEYSNSQIYSIVTKSNNDFITSERCGDIYEWEYIPQKGVFRTRKLLNAGNIVFAIGIIDKKLVIGTAAGQKLEYSFINAKHKISRISDNNIFCMKEGMNRAIYYGLSNGIIKCEEVDCDIYSLESHKDAVRDIVFSAKRNWMFSVSKDKTVRAWHNNEPKVLTRVGDYLYKIIVSQSNSSLYFVDGHGDLGIIDFGLDIDSVDKITKTNSI